ncbi:MAG: outer membrane beta-barrel protein [Terracidiphilus sp.]
MAQTGPANTAQPTLVAHTDAPAGDASTSRVTAAPTPESAIEQELEVLKVRIDQLEKEIEEERAGAAEGSSDAAALTAAEKKLVGGNSVPVFRAAGSSATPGPSASQTVNPQAMSAPTRPAAPDPHAPAFSDWDWTWLNGNPRNKDTAFDSKFFTPEIRADIAYAYDFSRPTDNTNSGSSEIFRTDEIQLAQLGIGGDFHLDHAHARFMTQFGMYSTATVRNDPSYAKGQWDIADADRYLSEAYGGYHINGWRHGLNFDAGIFMSYIGLFSYYNFDNWAYQPSFVSSNTPWFFQGIRIQMFPTEHLKIEPWFINGWQSYGSANNRKGLGGQIKWTPYPWMNIISNNYGLGHDDLYITHRGRIHTDNSLEIKYYDEPAKPLDKMAFSFTGDVGCEFGPTMNTGIYSQLGVSCLGDRKQSAQSAGTTSPVVNPKQSFVGYMIYNRFWFKKDLYGFTIGGGQINNPGRYLVLLPPINGESASSAALNAPYFTGNPGDQFKAWDGTLTFDYMPSEWFTWRWEYGYRHANVPYWVGHKGMTPPAYLGAPYGTNNGSPTDFACMDGSAVPGEGQVTMSGLTPTAPSFVYAYCGIASGPGFNGHGGVWFPALQRDQQYVDIDLEVKF